VSLGQISGVHGVKGWVKVYSYTEPRDNIVQFNAWILNCDGKHRAVEVEAGNGEGKNVIAKLRGIEDRDQANELVGAEIAVERDSLPACGPGEYYWTDLEGLIVHDVAGRTLGTVDHLLATGAHDVLVLAGDEPCMIPFVSGDVVRQIDIDGGMIVVDWDPNYWEE